MQAEGNSTVRLRRPSSAPPALGLGGPHPVGALGFADHGFCGRRLGASGRGRPPATDMKIPSARRAMAREGPACPSATRRSGGGRIMARHAAAGALGSEAGARTMAPRWRLRRPSKLWMCGQLARSTMLHVPLKHVDVC